MRKEKQATQHAESGTRELISQAQHGNMFAFEALVKRYRDNIYGFGLRVTRCETEAAEITQESFLSAYLHLNEFQNDADFAAWAHLIAATHAAFRLRFRGRGQAVWAPLEAPEFDAGGALAHHPRADSRDNWDEQGLSSQLRSAIEDATDRLPDQHREALLFKDVAGLGYEQIANLCGDSVPAVKNRLHQARLSLREAIDHFYRNGR